MAREKEVYARPKSTRISAVGPAVLSVVSFILTLLTLLAGQKPGMLTDAYLISLNTTSVGQNLVVFSSAISNGQTSTSNDPLSTLGSFFNDITGNLTDTISGGLNNAEGQLVEQVTKALGIRQFYTLNLLTVCDGNLSSTSDPDASFHASECNKYSDAAGGINQFLNVPPSSVTVGTMNVSVPILKTISNTGGMLRTFTIIFQLAFAFFTISLVCSAIIIVFSILDVFRASSKILVYGNVIASVLGVTFHSFGAVIVTATGSIAKQFINSIGNAIGISSKSGALLFAFVWVSFVCLLISSTYWVVVWFVEFRTRSFKARRRSPDEVGSYRGIIAEVRSDLRLPKQDTAYTSQWERERTLPSTRVQNGANNGNYM